VRAVAPSEIVVDKEPGGASSLDPGVVKPPDCRERGIRTTAFQNDGKCGERLLKIRGPEEALVPGKCWVEVVHKILRKDARISRCEGVQLLRRDRVEQGIDRIGVGSALLSAEPSVVKIQNILRRLNTFSGGYFSDYAEFYAAKIREPRIIHLDQVKPWFVGVLGVGDTVEHL